MTIKKIAKKLTLGMLIVAFVAGLVCVFVPALSIDKYAGFVKSFAVVYVPLIGSIGINSGIEKAKGKNE